MIKINVLKSQQISRDAGDKRELGEQSLCALRGALDTLHPSCAQRVNHACFIQHKPSCLTEVRANTDAHRKKKKKQKGVLFSLGGRDLETAVVNGRKTMKHFSSSSEEALPGSRSVTLLPASSSWEGRDGGRRCMCVCGGVIENVQ